MNERVLILSASIGTGHVRAAEALVEAFRIISPEVEVIHEDFLKFTNAAFRNLYAKLYLDLANKAPELLGWFYDFTDHPWKNQEQRLAFERLNTAPLRNLLKRHRPDVVLSTHFLPAEIISWLICRDETAVQNAIVITDLDINAMWLCHHYSRYFVAREETRQHLTKLGFDYDRITVSGIPIDPVFAEPKDKFEMRRKHGLDAELPVVILSFGGHAIGNMKQVIEQLLDTATRLQIVCLCGKNRSLFAELQEYDHRPPFQQNELIAVPYTEEIDEYFAAADVVVGKAGGLTTSEALARGCALVIVDPIPGQEERNADHLLEEGAAIRCNNLPVLAYKVESLIADPQRLQRMRQNALKIATPDAAQVIAGEVVHIANESASCMTSPLIHQCSYTWLPPRPLTAKSRNRF